MKEVCKTFNCGTSEKMWVTITILRSNLLIACIIQENQNLLDEVDAKRHLKCRFTNQRSVCETKKRRRDGMYEFCCLQQNEGYAIRVVSRSSYKERKGNALASGAEEGRDKLR